MRMPGISGSTLTRRASDACVSRALLNSIVNGTPGTHSGEYEHVVLTTRSAPNVWARYVAGAGLVSGPSDDGVPGPIVIVSCESTGSGSAARKATARSGRAL